MWLINAISDVIELQAEEQSVLVLSYIGLRLRDACSNINESDIAKLSKAALEYFRVNSLFLSTQVTPPTIWTIHHVVSVHTKYMYDVCEQGLLTVSMKGREAKHIALQQLSMNTSYQKCWIEIFGHEFIMLVWLPEHGHEPCSNTPGKDKYIPERFLNDPVYCYCQWRS